MKTFTNTINPLSPVLFVGGDIHKNNHTFVALNSFGQKMGMCETSDAQTDLQYFSDWIRDLEKRLGTTVMIGLEDSNGNGEVVSRFLLEQGFPVFAINPVLTSQRRKRTIHQEKSDEGDALLVTKILMGEQDQLPRIETSGNIQRATELKGVRDDYERLTRQQTRIKNQLHRLLYQTYGAEYREIFPKPFSEKALRYWLSEVQKTQERGPKSLGNKQSSSLTGTPAQSHSIRNIRIRQKVLWLFRVKEDLKELRKLMKSLFEDMPYANIATLAGCGLLTACRIIGEMKDIHRFSSSSKFAKYAGLAPREYSSGQSKKHRKSRSGNRQLNRAFYTIALSQIGKQRNVHAVNYYQRKISEGKTKQRALRSLARKNVAIVYAMMRDGSSYEPGVEKQG